MESNPFLFLTLPFLPLRFPSPKLAFPTTTTRLVAHTWVSDTTTFVDNKDQQFLSSVKPTYSPTPLTRHLRTPHSGYHFDGTTRKFFEGWYFKVSIPEQRHSFCFMHTVESPVFCKPLTRLQEAQYGPRFTGVAAQIMGPGDKYICQYSPQSQHFWGSRHELVLGNTFVANQNFKPPKKEIPPQHRLLHATYYIAIAMESKLWELPLVSSTVPLLPLSLPSLKFSFPSSTRTTTTRLVVRSSLSGTYTPTPSNRELRTPHSGYHFDGTARKFFEGWYFKVSIPERRQSFCFMYSVESPSFRKPLTPLELAQYGPRFTGVGAQILGPDDKYICQYSPESQFFWGSRHELMLGNTFVPNQNSKPPNKEVPPQEFDNRVLEGFQVTPLWHQGFIRDDGRSNYVETVKTARWEYSTRPVYGWGDVGSTQKSTAGWLAAFPVFEPHWQICMAAGLSTGWIEWDGERIEFENAPSYSEKNWGGAFPRKWFWVQCNVFEGASGEIALTAAGGLRQIPGMTETFENAALIGIHYDGKFYEFVPWNGIVNWEVSTWGYWFMAADNGKYVVELEATAEDPGTTLRAPTAEAGLAPACKDTCFGNLKLQLWERRYDGSKGKIILDVTSNMAALEVGGGPWFNTWKGKTSTPEVLSRALQLPIDVDSIFNAIPLFKPPGL